MSGSSLDMREVRGQADDKGQPLLPGLCTVQGAVHVWSSQGCRGLSCGCHSCPTLEISKHTQKLSNMFEATLVSRRQTRPSSLTPTPVPHIMDLRATSRWVPEGGREGAGSEMGLWR